MSFSDFLKSKTNVNWIEKYYKFDTKKFEYLLENKSENFWNVLGEQNALKLFHAASQNVPAYKDFLKNHKINVDKIKTIKDFSLIEPTDKFNYIKAYSLADRSWNGKAENNKIIASSSGTSGQPNFWPRSGYQEYEAAITHELLFKKLFNIHKYSTLVIVGFPMGVYVSGMATTLPAWLVAQKYNITLITVGNNKTEVLKAVKNLGGDFQQTLLIGHPFFIKDILETGIAEGVKWNKVKVKMMFCSEGFSEQWRQYVLKEASLNPKAAAAFNTYGSSEFLLMAYETPLSIAIRKIMETNPELAQKLAGNKIVPNLFQYNPSLRYIEEQKHELLFTSFSGTPLVRFNLHDSGKIVSYSDVVAKLPAHYKSNSWQLPFLTLKGRSDHTIIFYAANIYPEHIHHALSHQNFLKKITGKFTMSKGYYKNMDEFLEIQIEMKPKIKPTAKFQRLIQLGVIKKLKEINAEYNFLWYNLQKDIRPKIKLWPYQHEKYFKPGLKPKYII